VIDDPNIAIPQADSPPQGVGSESASLQADAAQVPDVQAAEVDAQATGALQPTADVPAAEQPVVMAAEATPASSEPKPTEAELKQAQPQALEPQQPDSGEAEPETLTPEQEEVPQSPPPAAEPSVSSAAAPPPVEAGGVSVAGGKKETAKGRAKKPAAEVQAAKPPAVEVPKSDKMDWYILKVQSNREESIREGLKRRVAIAGLEFFFGDVIIPTEKVTEFKAGKRKVFKRKLYPGYLVVQMEINEDTWFLVRETPGIGDFTGAAGHPTPMQAREVATILAKQEEKTDEAPRLKISFKVGDHVKIKEGTFENFEGDVANIDETNGRVTVLINIFGRSTPVDIEYWQIEAI
jgi:transcription termination/antitermination protein NusG